MWMSGKSAAHMTAKMVIASAERLIDVRQLLAEQQQDGGDQRAGVADADPEHEVGDVERPADGLVEAPGADAGRDLVGHAADADGERATSATAKQPNQPAPGRALERPRDVVA